MVFPVSKVELNSIGAAIINLILGAQVNYLSSNLQQKAHKFVAQFLLFGF